MTTKQAAKQQFVAINLPDANFILWYFEDTRVVDDRLQKIGFKKLLRMMMVQCVISSWSQGVELGDLPLS